MTKQWRMVYVYEDMEPHGLYSVALQYRTNEYWNTQCEYYVTLANNENYIPVVMLDDISDLIELGYKQTYSTKMRQCEIWSAWDD